MRGRFEIIPNEVVQIIESLQDELAVCKRDAERYQWLRDNIYYSNTYGSLEIKPTIPCHSSPNKADIDIAIDRAMENGK